MPKFRKKPVIIEAFQFKENMIEDRLFNNIPLPPGLKICAASYNPSDKKVHFFSAGVETSNGFMIANIGDWIIKNVNGEYYPCKPDIFEATYEPIE